MEDLSVNPKEEWLREYGRELTKKRHSQNFDLFCKWAKTSDVELVKEYKTSDPRDYAKKWGKKIIQYYNHIINEKGLKTNTARTRTIAPRAFFKSQCIEVKVKRGAIAKAKMAMGEHEFTLDELQKMYRVGSIEDKAKLATAISLGWGVEDFTHLKWKFVEPFLAENLEAPVAFWYEREKTGAPSRSHLTHEAIQSLRLWREMAPESPYVFSGKNGNPITQDAINDWLKSLARRTKINARGRIRFHLMRKFLMSQLSSSGMNQWETKLCVGKSIPSDILTYLKNQAQNLREKFMNAESRFTLTGYTNANHSKIEMINEKVETLEKIIGKQQVKIEALTKALEQRETEREKIKELVAKAIKDNEKWEQAMKKMGEAIEKLEKMFELQA